MRITRIRVYKTGLPYTGGTYAWGAGNAFQTAMASVVTVETDAGLTGCGEFTPCGENYTVAHSEGVEALARLVAPRLIGEDPRQTARIERLMDSIAQGHGYAKAPFDSACWDILGQATGQPVWMLLGGKLTDGAPLYRVAPQKDPDETVAEIARYREQGYRRFQIKAGSDWKADIERIRQTLGAIEPGETAMVDANQGWRVDQAIRVARATEDLDYIMEQPCKTYEECLQARRAVRQPMKLDECVTGIQAAQRIVADRGAEICCLKISSLGGLSKARKTRDYLVENRIPVVAEDTWGGEIASSALAHFAASTPEEYLLNTTDLMNYNDRSTGIGGPVARDGKLYAPDEPGLGVRPDFDSLGDPVATYGEESSGGIGQRQRSGSEPAKGEKPQKKTRPAVESEPIPEATPANDDPRQKGEHEPAESEEPKKKAKPDAKSEPIPETTPTDDDPRQKTEGEPAESGEPKKKTKPDAKSEPIPEATPASDDPHQKSEGEPAEGEKPQKKASPAVESGLIPDTTSTAASLGQKSEDDPGESEEPQEETGLAAGGQQTLEEESTADSPPQKSEDDPGESEEPQKERKPKRGDKWIPEASSPSVSLRRREEEKRPGRNQYRGDRYTDRSPGRRGGGARRDDRWSDSWQDRKPAWQKGRQEDRKPRRESRWIPEDGQPSDRPRRREEERRPERNQYRGGRDADWGSGRGGGRPRRDEWAGSRPDRRPAWPKRQRAEPWREKPGGRTERRTRHENHTSDSMAGKTQKPHRLQHGGRKGMRRG